MKLKILLVMLAIALGSFAQTATPAAPPVPGAKTCACCNHDKADGAKTGGTDGCKHGKCPMMSGSHAAMKCPMMVKNGTAADGKMRCSSNKCPMQAKGAKSSGCCCGNMEDQRPAGM